MTYKESQVICLHHFNSVHVTLQRYKVLKSYANVCQQPDKVYHPQMLFYEIHYNFWQESITTLRYGSLELTCEARLPLGICGSLVAF